jgi:fucose 4-O-acetylase-like acetyltransferase
VLPAGLAESPVATRRHDLDVLKGIATVLVVFGHLYPGAAPGVAAWYVWTHGAIYAFHMPLFMYVSGYVFALARSNERFEESPAPYVVRRADRLLVPLIAFALIIVGAKALVSRSVAVTDGVTDIRAGLWNVVSNTDPNPAFSLWYLIVLFVYAIGTPLLWRLAGRRLAPLLLLALVLAALPLTKLFYIEKISDFYIFFIVGALAYEAGSRLTEAFGKWCWGALVLFCLNLLLTGNIRFYLASFTAIVAFHGLALQGGRLNGVLDWVGRRVMAIYLMNTIFIGVAMVLAGRLGLPFGAKVVLGFTLGLLGPIAVKEAVDRLRPARRFARYLH